MRDATIDRHQPNALKLRRIHVRRTPGIADPFVLDGLSERVNLIHGPNASGKSSTARAIEAVLWPRLESGRKLSVSAEYTFEGSRYLVELDAGHVGVQRNGVDGHAPDLPAPELHQRYHLSLHDLLLATDKGDRFAEEIARQSTGGYDLPGAAEALGFRSRTSAATHELQALVKASRDLKEAQETQLGLHVEAQQLAELEARCTAAGAASARAQLLDRAVRHATSDAAVDYARHAVAAFPSVLRHLRGDEAAVFRDLDEQRSAASEEERRTVAQYDDAVRVAAAALPDGPLPGELIPVLHQEASALATMERAAEETERQARDATAQRAEARREIGAALTDEQLARIDGVTFGELADFAREAEQLAARSGAAEAEVRHAGDGVRPPDLEALRAGIRLLAQWITEGSPSARSDDAGARRPLLVWLIALVAVVGWGLLGARWHPVAALGVLVALGLAVWITRRGATAPATPETRAARVHDYVRLGLPQPATWSIEHVVAELDALHTRLADGHVAERRAAWRDEALRRRQDLEAQRQALEVRRATLVLRFGVAPDVDGRHLSWLADRIARWQDALRICQGAQDRATTARTQLDTALRAIGDRLAPYGYAVPTRASDAAGCVAALEARVRTYAAAIERREVACARLATIREEQQRLDAQSAALFAAAGIVLRDGEGLEALCAQHPACMDALKQLELAEHDLKVARTALESEPGFDPSLLGETAAALELARADAATLAADYGTLVSAVARLRTRVDAAKRQSDVEQALEARAAAEESLRGLRRKDLHALVGDVLVRHVQRATRDRHRPAVFHRARELFSVITRGRYLLEFQDADGGTTPTFRAVDSRTGVGHSLDQLSSATRVQLLLAVRVAFVETQEHGIRLPLFLDETLGTSDDHRAQAIIDAVIALAEDGRQIFYFTAQRDEVAKWTAALAALDVHYTEVDLVRVRSLVPESIGDLPMAVEPTLPAGPPQITEHDHRTYGHALGVPPVRPGVGSAAAAHLWYLVDDLGALHRILSFGVTTWGEMESLVEHGGIQILAEYPTVYARARALARTLDVMHEQAAIGRGRPVDRAVLLESKAVSSLKLDEVVQLAAKYGGSANDVIEALDRKEVVGFQAKKALELRGYLEREGFLDARPRRTDGEIRTAMLGVAMADVHAGTLAETDVDLLRQRIAYGAAGNGASASAASPLTGSPLALSTAPAGSELPA